MEYQVFIKQKRKGEQNAVRVALRTTIAQVGHLDHAA